MASGVARRPVSRVTLSGSKRLCWSPARSGVSLRFWFFGEILGRKNRFDFIPWAEVESVHVGERTPSTVIRRVRFRGSPIVPVYSCVLCETACDQDRS